MLGIFLVAVQHPVRRAMGDQLNRTDFFCSAFVHHFNHLAGEFSVIVVVKPLIHTGNGSDEFGDDH